MDVSKRCPKCNRFLPDSEFNWKNEFARRATYCKECSRELIQNHYQKNPQYYIKKAKIRNQRLKKKQTAYIAEYLLSHPCVDCGETDILVLEFDHRERSHKFSEIGHIIKQRLSLERLVQEIEKCEVRCANCHRRKTEKENNSWKLQYASVA